MKIKGTAVRSINDFVKKKFPDKYGDWLNSLPNESQDQYKSGLKSNEWYEMDVVAIQPTEKIGELFYNDTKKGAWESGRFSAKTALSGIYKLYVMASKPAHIIERANRIFAAYYQGAEMSSKQISKHEVTITIERFLEPNDVIECRIAGWIECALEISGCKDVDVKINKSMVKGDSQTVYNVNWN